MHVVICQEELRVDVLATAVQAGGRVVSLFPGVYFAENGTKNRFDQKIGEKEHEFFLKANHDS